MGINVRQKGQRGEREASVLLQEWAEPVTRAMGVSEIALHRNLDQSRVGGYDLLGLDWLALEVKRHENLQVSQWWKQTVRQANADQIPFLMYRQNRTPWRFRVQVQTAHFGLRPTTCGHLVVDMDADNARHWFQHELYCRLENIC